MKKILTLVLTLALGLNLFGQNKAIAPNFTATDVHGHEINLYDILDGGQYVLIDFFFTACGPCNTTAPKVEESYHYFGCNDHDVFYMEISPSDDNEALKKWIEKYNIEYPTIGKDSNGQDICGAYGIQYYPTVILISPEKEIIISDLWPIPTAQTIIDALEEKGIEKHECTSPIVDIEAEQDSNLFSVYPNPAKDHFVVKSRNAKEIKVYTLTGQIIQQYKVTDEVMNISTDGYPNGIYIVKIQNRNGKYQQFKLTINH